MAEAMAVQWRRVRGAVRRLVGSADPPAQRARVAIRPPIPREPYPADLLAEMESELAAMTPLLAELSAPPRDPYPPELLAEMESELIALRPLIAELSAPPRDPH
jgi:hypothetical protein